MQVRVSLSAEVLSPLAFAVVYPFSPWLGCACFCTCLGWVGLFSAAIMESGSCDTNQFFQSLSEATAFGYDYAAGCGCNFTGSEYWTKCWLRCLASF